MPIIENIISFFERMLGTPHPKKKKRSLPRNKSVSRRKTTRANEGARKPGPGRLSSPGQQSRKPQAKKGASAARKVKKKVVAKEKVAARTKRYKGENKKTGTAPSVKKKAVHTPNKARQSPVRGRALPEVKKKNSGKPVKQAQKKVKRPSAGNVGDRCGSAAIEFDRVGQVTHYFSKIMVCVVRVEAAAISLGDQIVIKGKKTKLSQKVQSLQVESVDVKSAKRGQLVGLKVVSQVCPGDVVQKIRK